MKAFRIICIGVIVLGVLALMLRFFTIKIEPGTTGVVNAKWTTGVVEKDYGPGFWWDIGPLHEWDVFDTTVQSLHMTRRQAADDGDVEVPLTVRSSDGANVTLDMTIKYQIKSGEAWQLRKSQGAGNRYKAKVRNEVIDILRQALGTLRTEDFYAPEKRQQMIDRMTQSISARLDLVHVALIAILIRDLEFEEAFEARIKEKVLAKQEVELNKALTKAADALGKTREIEADTEARVQVIEQEKERTIAELRAENDKKVRAIEADYRKSVEQTKSDADLYASLKDAEGIQVTRDAEAQAQDLRRGALAIPGAANLVALEIATNLTLGDIAVSTQLFNPVDVGRVLELLGTEPAAK